jgi:putative oxidoreductase
MQTSPEKIGDPPFKETTMIDQRTAAYAALILRVSLGVMLLAHGLLLKVFTFTVAGTVGYFESIGYPGVFAYLVIAGEILGGLALILGVQTRLVALLMLPILIGATLQHLGNGWVFSAPKGGWEFPAFWSIALVVQALLGDGAYALSSSKTTFTRPSLA